MTGREDAWHVRNNTNKHTCAGMNKEAHIIDMTLLIIPRHFPVRASHTIPTTKHIKRLHLNNTLDSKIDPDPC